MGVQIFKLTFYEAFYCSCCHRCIYISYLAKICIINKI
nr:MAG TPA: hypothetical protein [Caudoviricetes sp.]